MIDKLILLLAIALLFVGVASILLAREIVRKKKEVNNENTVVRNVKIIGIVVVIISLVTIYFCKLGGI